MTDQWLEIISDPKIFRLGQKVYLAAGSKNIEYFVTAKRKSSVVLSLSAPKPRGKDLSFEAQNTFWRN
jgi:hypothetical protein